MAHNANQLADAEMDLSIFQVWKLKIKSFPVLNVVDV